MNIYQYASAHMVGISGNCQECGKDVNKRITSGQAKRMKYMLCGSYNCKRLHENRLARERSERAARLEAKRVKV